MKVKQNWSTKNIGNLKTPNPFIGSSNNVLIWNQFGFDIDSTKLTINLNGFCDVDINPNNNYKHIFIKLLNIPSYRGLINLIQNSTNKIESTISSLLVDSPYSKVSLISDSIAYDVYEKYAKVFKADPMTSTHINHPFRTSDSKDKPYKRIENANKQTSIFRLASQCASKKTFRKILDEIFLKSIIHGLPTLRVNDRYDRKVTKKFKSKWNIIGLLSYIFKKYYIKGYRQTLCLISTGILYRYVTKSPTLIENTLSCMIPKDDEEYHKRFDPIKYLKNNAASLKTLFKTLKKIDSHINLKALRHQFRYKYKRENELSYNTHVSRDFRRRYDDFESIQLLVLVLIGYGSNFMQGESDFNLKFQYSWLRKTMKNLARSEDQKYIFPTSKIKKFLLKLCNINLLYNLNLDYRDCSFTIRFEVFRELTLGLTYDMFRNQLIIFNLYKLLNGKMSLKQYKEKITDPRRLNCELNLKWLSLFIFYIRFEILDDTKNLTLAIRHTLFDIDSYLRNNYEFKWRNVTNDIITHMINVKNYIESIKLYNLIQLLNYYDFKKFVDPFSQNYKKKLINKLFYANIETFIKIIIPMFINRYKKYVNET